jgi:hypothetical protein
MGAEHVVYACNPNYLGYKDIKIMVQCQQEGDCNQIVYLILLENDRRVRNLI